MKRISSPATAARVAASLPRPLVLVPTMGALHEGHLSLVDRARRLAGPGGTVAVSIFVNPAQFGPREDYARYPRPLGTDLRFCRERGVDLVFTPSADSMYAADHSIYIEETALSAVLCGAARPGHFRGVCTVVAKLFNIVRPEIALFGRKDFQQLAIIRRMVRDLDFPVRIVAGETVREPDGLALSSRNRYLSEEERAQGPVIRRALLAALARVRKGERRVTLLRRFLIREITAASLARIDYVEIIDANTLRPVKTISRNNVAVVALFFGSTRLIDNIHLA